MNVSHKRVLTADTAIISSTGEPLFAPHVRRNFTQDAVTYDSATIDSLGAFLKGELERLDMKMHEPLVSVTWSRDIDLRTDVTMGDELSSFTQSTFAAVGGVQPNGISWIGKDTNTISNIALDVGKVASALYLWGMETSWTLPELASAQQIGRPIDTAKYNGLMLKHQMDLDQIVYIGDTTLNTFGLLNLPQVTAINAAAMGTQNGVAAGTPASALWINKTPQQILQDVNAVLTQAWTNSFFAIMPTELRLPPVQYGYLVSQLISAAGANSVLEFLRNNSLCNVSNGRPLNLQPCKWLTGRGAGGLDRAIAYTKDIDRVRFPMVPLQRTPLEYRSIYQRVSYYGRMGTVETPYPETLLYLDGI